MVSTKTVQSSQVVSHPILTRVSARTRSRVGTRPEPVGSARVRLIPIVFMVIGRWPLVS